MAPQVGEAICPYCASMLGQSSSQALVSGDLITDYDTLLRHRDESQDEPYFDRQGNQIGTRAKMAAEVIGGVEVQVPAGLRPIFLHQCAIAKRTLTLYADTKGEGRVQ